jgi:hypothetical protein
MPKRKLKKKTPFSDWVENFIPVLLLFMFLVFLAGIATVQKVASVQETTAVAVTGAAVTDLASGTVSLAAAALLLFLIFVGGSMLGIGSYFFVQINRNDHTKFMIKQMFIDLGKAVISKKQKK